MLNELIRDVSENAITHGGLPFWSWNDKLEEDELRRQIEDFKKELEAESIETEEADAEKKDEPISEDGEN